MTPEPAVSTPGPLSEGALPRLVLVAAHQEGRSIFLTLASLRNIPDAELIVADDASRDGTAHFAWAFGAKVIRTHRSIGKGGNVTNALFGVIAAMPPETPDSPEPLEQAQAAMRATIRWQYDFIDRLGIPSQVLPLDPELDDATVVLLCDADLEESADQLIQLIEAVERGECDVAIASFRDREGGGFGMTAGYARSQIRDLCGFRADAPLSGQRVMRLSTLRNLLPFADGWGLEFGMTVDAVRAGYRLKEIELPLSHRVTGRTPAGFLHRARQLRDIRQAARTRRQIASRPR